MKELTKFEPMRFQEATYTDSFNELWTGNPLIESLPQLLDPEEFIERLYYSLNITQEQRSLGKQQRCMLVSNLKQVFYPLNIHIDLYYSIMQLISSGYMDRNPLKYENLKVIREFDEPLPQTSHFSSMALIGLSGMGKTTTIERILGLIPQVQEHRNYHGRKYYGIQVNWLKVDCSFDSSLGGFCREIFKNLDELLGTNYLTTFGSDRSTISSMINVISRIFADINLGLLAVDEFQHILNRKSKSNDLNSFLTTFSNSTKVPLFIIGTPKAEKAFSEAFRTTRRYMDDGAQYWDRIQSPDDPVWNEWLSWLFDFQYTKIPTKLTKELSDKFYEYSQGIFSIVNSLFRKVQSYIISNPDDKEEIITPDKIDYVFNAYFKPLGKVIDAIKNNDYEKLENLEDLLLKVDRSSFNFPHRIQFYNTTKEVLNEIEAARIVKDNLKNEMVSMLQSMDLKIPKGSIKELVEDVIDNNPELSERKLRTKIMDTALNAQRKSKVEKPKPDFSTISDQKGMALEFIE